MQLRREPYLLLFLLLVLVNYSLSASIIEANSNGLWSEGSTWLGGSAPTASDSVVIDGFEVEGTGLVTSVKHIRITNDSGNKGTLTLNGATILTVDNGIYLQGEGRNQDVYIHLYGNAILNVNGLFKIDRLSSNSDDNKVGIYAYNNVEIYANAGFIFDYQSSAPDDNNYEIYLTDKSKLEINGDADFFNRNGNHLSVGILWEADLIVNGSLKAELSNGDSLSFYVSGVSGKLIVEDTVSLINNGSAGVLEFQSNLNGAINFKSTLNMVSTGAGHKVSLLGNAPTVSDILVGGDINMDTYLDDEVQIVLNSFSYLYLEGNINRLHGHGSLSMSNDAYIIFRGDSPQIIPGTAGVGTDSIEISNLSINNTSDSIILGGPLLLTNNLVLDTGIIFTSSTNILELANGVQVSGGSEVAYIDGPMRKIGETNGLDFTFPIGKEGFYSPLTISQVSNSSFEYTAEYFHTTPPPAPLDNSLVNVSSLEFWELDSSVGSDPVKVTINWHNSAMSGITDIDSLVMARHDDATDEWVSLGSGGTTEDLSDGSGSIVHDFGCPPPCCHSIITLGSTSAVNSLPLDLINFAVKKTGDLVDLNWLTSNEINIEKIEVERSFDGIRFEAIDQVYANGGLGPFLYESTDRKPNDGVNYYRLKITEFLGTVAYSDIQFVDFDRENSLRVFPNPVLNKIQIMGSQFSESESKIEVINQSGQIIYQGIRQLEKSENSIFADELNINLPGIYFLFITNNGKTSVANFVKEE